jgi:hypothetical protein
VERLARIGILRFEQLSVGRGKAEPHDEVPGRGAGARFAEILHRLSRLSTTAPLPVRASERTTGAGAQQDAAKPYLASILPVDAINETSMPPRTDAFAN